MLNFTILILGAFLHLTASFEIQPRIVNGLSAHPGQFPYFVDLEIYMYTEYTPKIRHVGTNCGGALISTEFILTAAHCLTEGKYVNAYFGTTHILKKQRPAVYTITRENFHLHPEYCHTSNDIGMKMIIYWFVIFRKIKFFHILNHSSDTLAI